MRAAFPRRWRPAFRLGFLAFDKALTARITVAKQCTDVHSTTLFQYICNEYMTKCDYKGHIERTCALYRHKCDLMLGEMEKKFHPDVRFNRPEGGLFVMAFLPEGWIPTPLSPRGSSVGSPAYPALRLPPTREGPTTASA